MTPTAFQLLMACLVLGPSAIYVQCFQRYQLNISIHVKSVAAFIQNRMKLARK